MLDLVVTTPIPAMTPATIDNVRWVESEQLKKPQVPIKTWHLLHGGMYSRTILIPKRVRITGALVKPPTQLFICGRVDVYVGGDRAMRFSGFKVIPASAGRKQIIQALIATYFGMVFVSDATTLEEAERQFTDETDLLASRRDGLNHVLITGE